MIAPSRALVPVTLLAAVTLSQMAPRALALPLAVPAPGSAASSAGLAAPGPAVPARVAWHLPSEPGGPFPQALPPAGDAESVVFIHLAPKAGDRLLRGLRKESDPARLPLPDSLRALNEQFGVRRVESVLDPERWSPDALERLRLRHPLRARRAVSATSARPRLDHLFKLELASGRDAAEAQRAYDADPATTFAGRNHVYQAEASDELLPDQWALATIRAACAWPVSEGAGVLVAVIDSGADATHPDLADRMYENGAETGPGATPGVDDDDPPNGYVDDVSGWDFVNGDADAADDYGHGTHVATTVAASANGTGICGVAPLATILPVKGLAADGGSTTEIMADAIAYALERGADIINASWGGGGRDPVLELLVDAAHDQGVLFVTSAGNSATPVHLAMPANAENSLAVAATDDFDLRAYYSNTGTGLDVAAPGGDACSVAAGILAGYPSDVPIPSVCATVTDSAGGLHVPIFGTSMSCPEVAGLAALLVSIHPDWTTHEIKHAIRQGATDRGAAGHDERYGYGRIDACSTLTDFGPAAVPPPSASLTEPFGGTRVFGSVEVRGLADFEPGGSYVVELAEGDDPRDAAFAPITAASGTPTLEDALLTTWDAGAAAEGEHVLRVVSSDGTGTSQDRNLVFVDNVFVSSPAPYARLAGDPAFAVTGRVPGSNQGEALVSRVLDWRLVGQATWTTISTESAEVDPEGVLATWDLSVVPEGLVELRLTASYAAHAVEESLTVIVDRAMLAGWPAELETTLLGKALKMADLDGDGTTELVAGLAVLQADGTLRPGWTAETGHGRTVPAILDIDGDPELEIVGIELHRYTTPDPTRENDGAPVLRALDPDGTQLWSFIADNPDHPLNLGVPTSVAAGDVDGDALTEIVFAMAFTYANPDESSQVFVLDAASGSLEAQATVPGMAFGGLALVDLDGDADVEIVLVTDPRDFACRVDALQVSGGAITSLPGWPISVGNGNCNWSPSAGDFDRDGEPEVLAGKTLVEADGTALAGWPASVDADQASVPAAFPESGCGLGVVVPVRFFLDQAHAFGADGALLWERGIGGGETTPRVLIGPEQYEVESVLGDLDGDGEAEVVLRSDWGYGDRAHPAPLYAAEGADGASPSSPPALVFPKWVSAELVTCTPALGDLDGDGLTDLAVLGGNLVHAWRLPASWVEGSAPWPSFQHDLRNTGFRPPDCEPAPPGLVSFYSFEEPAGTLAIDTVGGFDGTLEDGPVRIAGSTGQALAFDGSGARVQVPTAPSHAFATGDFSLVAWLRTTTASGFGTVVDRQTLAPAPPAPADALEGYSLYVSDGRLAFRMNQVAGFPGPAGGGAGAVSTVPDVADGLWHFVAVTIDRDDPVGGTLWVDGAPVEVFDPTTAPTVGGAFAFTRIGDSAASFGGSRPLTGDVDEVMIFERALTPAEIAALAGTAGCGACR